MTSDTTQDVRIEHDSMGEVRVPRDAKWRAQTQRAVENFPISGATLERSHVEALARIKAGLPDRLYLGNHQARRDPGTGPFQRIRPHSSGIHAVNGNLLRAVQFTEHG